MSALLTTASGVRSGSSINQALLPSAGLEAVSPGPMPPQASRVEPAAATNTLGPVDGSLGTYAFSGRNLEDELRKRLQRKGYDWQ